MWFFKTKNYILKIVKIAKPKHPLLIEMERGGEEGNHKIFFKKIYFIWKIYSKQKKLPGCTSEKSIKYIVCYMQCVSVVRIHAATENLLGKHTIDMMVWCSGGSSATFGGGHGEIWPNLCQVVSLFTAFCCVSSRSLVFQTC